MSQYNMQAIRGLYDAFNRGDLDSLERGFSRDILWNEAESSLYCGGNPYLGFASVRDGVFAATARDFDGFRCEVEQLYDAGEYVVGTGRYRGKSRATGKQLAAQFCHVMHLDDAGLLDRVQEYADTLAEAEVMGQAQRLEELKMPHPVM